MVRARQVANEKPLLLEKIKTKLADFNKAKTFHYDSALIEEMVAQK